LVFIFQKKFFKTPIAPAVLQESESENN